eukprot:9984392-Ditylum_brightwellii.AAC.1
MPQLAYLTPEECMLGHRLVAAIILRGPMNQDAYCVSAAISSGIGFLGSTLIFNNVKSDSNSSNGDHTVSVKEIVHIYDDDNNQDMEVEVQKEQ